MHSYSESFSAGIYDVDGWFDGDVGDGGSGIGERLVDVESFDVDTRCECNRTGEWCELYAGAEAGLDGWSGVDAGYGVRVVSGHKLGMGCINGSEY